MIRFRRTSDKLVLALVATAVLSTLLAFCSLAKAEGLSFALGLGVHAERLSAPDYTTPNPLGIAELRYTDGPLEYSLEHSSSLQGFPKVFSSPDENGYGINRATVRWRLDL